MSGRVRDVPKWNRWLAMAITFAVATLIVGGLLGILNSNLFWGEAEQFGTIAIPGRAILDLPSGVVEVSVAAALPGRGNETPVMRLPALDLKVAPTDGGDPVEVEKDLGETGNANGNGVDTQRRVWKVDIPDDGDYAVSVRGDFDGYGVNPQARFGKEPAPLSGGLLWIVAALVTAAGFGIAAGIRAFRRRA